MVYSLLNSLYINEDKNIIGVLIEKKYAQVLEDIFIYNDKSTLCSFEELSKTSNILNKNNNITINNILLNKIFINDEKLIKFANSVLNFGYKLEGGKSRNSVKTDNNIVVKSNSDYDEYYRMCLCFIMKIPINPPIGLLILKNHNNVIEKYIIEKYINNNKYSDTFAKCLINQNVRLQTQEKFNNLVKSLKKANVAGDFKLDNILFDNYGNFILTDFTNNSRKNHKFIPIKFKEWEPIATRESGDFNFYIDFSKRLIYYFIVTGKWSTSYKKINETVQYLSNLLVSSNKKNDKPKNK
jgi:hypothetical protein